MAKVSKEQIEKLALGELKVKVEKQSWVALAYYFGEGGNGPEAKVAVVALGVLAKEQQAMNNKRQLDLVEAKLLRDKEIEEKKLLSEGK